MKKRPITQTEQLVIRMPADMRKAVKAMAEQAQQPEAQLVRRALRDLIDRRAAQAAA